MGKNKYFANAKFFCAFQKIVKKIQKIYENSMSSQEISEEDRQTLFVAGISKDVDEEILYELFLNAGPLYKVNIPMDHNTKRQKNFAFVRFQHEESVKYAVELFRGIKLFGQSLSMQNRKTGVGMQQNRHQNDNSQRMQTQRSNSMPNRHQQDQQQVQYQQQYYQQPQGFQQPRSFQDHHQDPYYRRDNHDHRQYQNDHRQDYDRSRQGQYRNYQEDRRHHSYDRDDRNAPPQRHHEHEYRDRSREFRDRSHDRRQQGQQNRHRRF